VAIELGAPVLQPEKARGDEFLASISELRPDLSVVAAYGQLLVDEVLALPAGGSINVHASLLPELRGAAPINWAIIRGHDLTGVTIMRMVREMDAGPILHQVAEPIGPDTTAGLLSERLSELGAEALAGSGHVRSEDESRAGQDRLEPSGLGDRVLDAGLRSLAGGVDRARGIRGADVQSLPASFRGRAGGGARQRGGGGSS
jgi:hypothetical protein